MSQEPKRPHPDILGGWYGSAGVASHFTWVIAMSLQGSLLTCFQEKGLVLRTVACLTGARWPSDPCSLTSEVRLNAS